MYDVQLSESLFPAQTDSIVREITVGGVLREVAAQHSSAPAVVDVDIDGQTGRTWTSANCCPTAKNWLWPFRLAFAPENASLSGRRTFHNGC